jgi:hypothetical protein
MRWAWVVLVATALVGVSVAGGATSELATADADHPTAADTSDAAEAVRGSDAVVERRSVTPNQSSDRDSDAVGVRANATYDRGDNVTVTVSGVQGRVYAVYVYDGNGTRVATRRTSLDDDRQPFAFGALDPGSYRVVVVEAYTSSQANATFGVGGAYQPGVVPEVTVDQPADVVSVPLSLPNDTTRATIDLRDDRGEYRVTATVEDRNGDGTVLLDWNTFYAGRGKVALTAHGDDAVVNATRDGDLDGFLREAEYHLVVRANGRTLDRGAVLVDLEPLLTSRIDVYEAPATGSPEESLAQGVTTGRVETDEWLFVVVHSEGIFGAVNATRDLRSVGPDQVVLSITTGVGDEGVSLVDADYVHVEEGRIVVGFAPGNDALAANTTYDVDFRITRQHPYRGGDETLHATVDIVPAGSEPDHPVVALDVVDAPASVQADGVANFTLTLVNSGERTGTVPVSVTIGGHVVSRDVTVAGNGQTTIDLSFDTAQVLEGNRTYVVSVNGTRHTGSIVVGDESKDRGPTLASRDRGDDAVPGFTAAAALLAVATLVGVAVRRN